MKYNLLLLTISALLTTLTACSPTEPPNETLLDNQKETLDKAKQVEDIGLNHKLAIDDAVKKAESN